MLGASDFSHRIIRPFAYNQSLQHSTIAVLLIKILIVFRPLSSVHLFRSNQSFEALENRFDQATIISPNFHRLRWECLAQLLPLLCHKCEEKRVADYESRCLRKRD